MARQKIGKAFLGFTVIILLAAAVWLAANQWDSTATPQAPVEEESAAEPELPGEPFEALGSMGALRGAPQIPINLWDNPDRSSHSIRVVGQISPGQSITITRRFRDAEEDQLYYRVSSGELVGWVPETLVNVDQE